MDNIDNTYNMSKSKKTFVGGLNSLLGETSPAPTQQRVIAEQAAAPSSDARATFVLSAELLERLRAAAYWNRVPIKNALEEAITEYLKKYKPKPRPQDVVERTTVKRAKSIKTKLAQR